MNRTIIALAGLLISLPTYAGAQSEFCESAAVQDELKKQLPTYALASEVETQAKSEAPYLPHGLIRRLDRGDIVCIGLGVDETGTVKDLALYSGKKVSLPRSERKALHALTYIPAQSGGESVPSIVTMTVWVQ